MELYVISVVPPPPAKAQPRAARKASRSAKKFAMLLAFPEVKPKGIL